MQVGRTIFGVLILACAAINPAFADDTRRREIEKRGLEIATDLCGEDLGCRYLREGYESEDAEYKRIAFASIGLYIQQTLTPKLPDNPATKKKLLEFNKLFEEHLSLSSE